MNRDIEFRVWDRSNKQYLEELPDFFFGYTDERYFKGEPCFRISLKEAIGDDIYFVQQYTGLKDKKGNKIFEGDIVFDADDIAHYEVKFKHGSFVVYRKKKKMITFSFAIIQRLA